jgi:hypothetical protein
MHAGRIATSRLLPRNTVDSRQLLPPEGSEGQLKAGTFSEVWAGRGLEGAVVDWRWNMPPICITADYRTTVIMQTAPIPAITRFSIPVHTGSRKPSAAGA